MRTPPFMNYCAALWSLALLFTSPLVLAANVSLGFSVAVPPPAPVVEPAPPPSAPSTVWTPGYWSWDGVKYVWVPGQYVVAPFPDAVWIGGRWVHRGPGWMWVDGRWHRR